MLSELPDLDEDVSFVVDDGASTGPVPLRLIVASVMSGQRASNVLVWWAGATDWMRFDSHPDLVALLNPAADQDDASADAANVEPVMTRWGAGGGEVVFADEPEAHAVDASATESVVEPDLGAEVDAPAADEPLYVEFVDIADVADIDDAEPDTAAAAVEEWLAAEEPAQAEDVLPPDSDEPVMAAFPDPVVEQFVAAEQFVPVESVQADAPLVDEELPAADDGAAADSDGTVSEVADAQEPSVDVAQVDADVADVDTTEDVEFDDTPLDDTTSDDTPSEQVAHEASDPQNPDEPDEPGSEAFSFGLPVRETAGPDHDSSSPAAGLTGLFSSGAREHGGLTPSEPQTPSPDALDAIMAARVSLESVGARIDALTSATRRTAALEQQPGADGDVQDLGGLDELDDERESVLVASVSSREEVYVDAEPEAVEADAMPGGSWRAVDDEAFATDASDAVLSEQVETEAVAEIESPAAIEQTAAHMALSERFEEMVRKSVSHQRRIEWVMRVDELLLSACITAIADSGFVAMDLTSRDSDHRVLFDHNSDSRQVRLELSPVDTVSDHLGRHVRFGLSWGRDVDDIDAAIATVDREAVEETVPAGVLMCDADMSSGVVSTHVELILAADDFVKDDYSVDRQSLDAAIAATLHALEARWHLLFD